MPIYYIHLGDCYDWMNSLPDGCVDFVLTDPSYKCKTKMFTGGGLLRNRESTAAKLNKYSGVFDPKQLLDTCHRLCRKPFSGYFFCNQNGLVDYISWAKEKKYAFVVMFWHKGNAMPLCHNSLIPDAEFIVGIHAPKAYYNRALPYAEKSRLIVEPLPNLTGSKTPHPNQKPVKVIERLLKQRTKKGWVILDPFTGSGTVPAACAMLGRHYLAADNDPQWHALASQRVMNVTRFELGEICQ